MKELNTDFYIPLVTLKVCREKLVPFGLDGRYNYPESIAKIGQTLIGDSDKECMLVVNLDSQCYPVSVECICVGRTNRANVELRNVITSSLMSGGCCAIVLIHNHVSGGEIIPSNTDWNFTKRVMEACDFMGIQLLDHVIVNHKDFYSMKENEKWEEMKNGSKC